MKKHILLSIFFALSCNQIQAKTHTDSEEIARTFDIFIAAYNSAQTEIAEQNHQPTDTLSDEQIEKLKRETTSAINMLESLANQLEQRNIKEVEHILNNLQTQFDQSGIRVNKKIFENSANYLRRWDKIKQEWQEKHPDQPLQDLSTAEIEDLLQLVQNDLDKGTKKELEIGQAIGGMWTILNAFEKMSKSPSSYADQEQALSQEVLQLQALAESQDIKRDRQIDANRLLDTLKIRVAEHQIGINSPTDIQTLQTQWTTLLEHPQPLFNEKEFDIAERLLRTMGNEFSVIHHKFQHHKEDFIIY